MEKHTLKDKVGQDQAASTNLNQDKADLGNVGDTTAATIAASAFKLPARARRRSISSPRLAGGLLALVSIVSLPAWASDPPGRDSILDWNAIALQAVAEDHSGTFGGPEQGGPTRASRALAIVHAAMYDALNSIDSQATPYFTSRPAHGASIDTAVATAARRTLKALYPAQASVFDHKYADYLDAITNRSYKRRGVQVGAYVAKKLLKAREHDGSRINPPYIPSGEPGVHDVDPLNPNQGFLTTGWGDVKPFALNASFNFVPLPPPDLGSPEYAAAFNDVKNLGGDGVNTPTLRTAEQTEIGLYWAYDGAPGLGVPPRLYNQIVRVIANQEGNTEAENARLFALINIAQADAAIHCWDIKYTFNFWRPILGLRRADEDGNAHTEKDKFWTPLGAPFSNNPAEDGHDFTPSFPAYSSGHATFGASVFRTLEWFYGTDEIGFTFVSDELNGVTKDSFGNVRPFSPRSFTSFSDAAEENARSRIYLGVHWQFDADKGLASGNALADHVFDTVLQPLH